MGNKDSDVLRVKLSDGKVIEIEVEVEIALTPLQGRRAEEAGRTVTGQVTCEN